MGSSINQTPFGEINKYDYYLKSNSPEIEMILDNTKIIPGITKLSGSICFNLSSGWLPKNGTLIIFRHEYANFLTYNSYLNDVGEEKLTEEKHLVKKLYPTYRTELVFSNTLINKYNFCISIPRSSNYPPSFEVIDQFTKSEVLISYFINLDLNIQINNQIFRLSTRTKFDVLSFCQQSSPSIDEKEFKLSKGIIFLQDLGTLRLSLSVNNNSIKEGDSILAKYLIDNRFSAKHIKSMKFTLYENILVKGIKYPDGNQYITQKQFGPGDKIWANQIKDGILPGSFKEGTLKFSSLLHNSNFRNLCTSIGSKIQRLYFLRLEVSLETKSLSEKIRFVECPLYFYNENYLKGNNNPPISSPFILNSFNEIQYSSNMKGNEFSYQNNLRLGSGNLLQPNYRICLVKK